MARRKQDGKPRRARGTGTISERKDGRFDAEITLHTAAGKRRLRTTVGSELEADRWLSRIKRDHEQGRLNLEASTLTVGDYLDRWLKDSVAGTVGRHTYRDYSDKVRLHIAPVLGHLKLADLRADHLQALYAHMSAQGASARTVRYVHTTLGKALHQAEAWDLVPKNVARFARPPKPEHTEREPMSLEEAKVFLRVVKGDPYEAVYLIAVTTAMRRGELFGLKWEDLDLEAGRYRVRRSLDTIYGPPAENAPKRKASRRPGVLLPQVVSSLRNHRRRQLEAKLIAGPRWQENGYVFPTSRGTPQRADNVLKRSLKPLCRRAGIRELTFTDLRHSVATFLVILNVHPRVAQRMLGHGDITTTMNVYSHAPDELQEEAARRLGDLLFGDPKEAETDADGPP